MSLLTYVELREQLVAACRARKWRPPTQQRLKKLRESGQLPKSVAHYEKGRRGRLWLYESSTIAAYIRAEEQRRASGSRVRSWKVIEQREKAEVLRDWIAKMNDHIPRDAIGDALEEFAALFRRIAAGAYAYVEDPVGPLDDDRLDGAHTAVESALDTSGVNADFRPLVEALLQILVFRDEDGNAEDVDLPELLAPFREKAGPFAAISGIAGVRQIVADIPLNDLLTRPRTLLAEANDDELRRSLRMTVGFFNAMERLAKVANAILTVIGKAKSDDRLRDDVRVDWGKPIAEGATAISNLLQSDFAPVLTCASALVNVWLIRRKPDAELGADLVTGTINKFASTVEQSSFAPKKVPLAVS
jgi:hypothetical protein